MTKKFKIDLDPQPTGIQADDDGCYGVFMLIDSSASLKPQDIASAAASISVRHNGYYRGAVVDSEAFGRLIVAALSGNDDVKVCDSGNARIARIGPVYRQLHPMLNELFSKVDP